jgi:hypothetical protein
MSAPAEPAYLRLSSGAGAGMATPLRPFHLPGKYSHSRASAGTGDIKQHGRLIQVCEIGVIQRRERDCYREYSIAPA